MQKKWTIVVEITDEMYDAVNDDGESLKLTRSHIEDIILPDCPAGVRYQIMEIIDAPYGPQRPDGVFIVGQKPRFKVTQVCICRPGSRFANPNCRAKVHKP